MSYFCRVIYREFQPHALLLPYIETYWLADGFQGTEECQRILPDGCVDIIISLNASTHCGWQPFRPNLVGTMTTFYDGSYVSGESLFGIRFRPVGFTAFCRVPIQEFTDERMELTAVESLFGKEFYEDMAEKETTEALVRHVDSYLVRKLGTLFAVERQIVFAVDLIRRSNGLLTPGEVADKSCLSLRQLERKFKASVGISPKMFSRIIKFRYACNYLEARDYTGLFSAAIDCGYYDQAHLIKEFKAFSGNVPSDFQH